jgi:hypothetical protein
MQYIPQSCRKNNVYQPHSNNIYQLYNTTSRHCLIAETVFFPLWPFDSIPGHAFPSPLAIRVIEHTTIGRTSLDEWSARRRNLYMTAHNNQDKNIHAHGGIRTVLLVLKIRIAILVLI